MRRGWDDLFSYLLLLLVDVAQFPSSFVVFGEILATTSAYYLWVSLQD
jgi:hypothetical protein